MLNRFIFILTAVYFLGGTVLLPQEDFSALSQLRGMYHHCKTVEDPDMDLADFVTEHLLNMGDMFEENDDEPDEHELPHSPIPFHTTTIVAYFVNRTEIISFETKQADIVNLPEYHSPYFPRLNTNKIFQPPRV